MPSVVMFVRGENLQFEPCNLDVLCVKGDIKRVSFITVDNGRSDYDIRSNDKHKLTIHGNSMYLEYFNHEFVVILGDVQWFEVESGDGTTHKVYELRDPVILLHNLTNND